MLDEPLQRPQYGRLPHLHLRDSLIRDQTRRYTGRVRLRELRAAHVDQRRHPAHVEREAIFVADTLTVTSVVSFGISETCTGSSGVPTRPGPTVMDAVRAAADARGVRPTALMREWVEQQVVE